MPVRKATYEETQDILNYALVVMHESTMGFVKQNVEKAQKIMGPILVDGGYYLVYEEDRIIQGWIGLGTMYDFYSDETVGTIPEIYVLPAFRNRGVAERLLEETFKQLTNDGVDRVQLNVFAGNKAKELYEKLGFQDVATLMEKKLTK